MEKHIDNKFLTIDLMFTLVNAIVSVDAVADHMDEVTVDLVADGQTEAVDVLYMLARNHRVRVLELQGQLAVPREEYNCIIDDANADGKR